jgi:hypothetical protein
MVKVARVPFYIKRGLGRISFYLFQNANGNERTEIDSLIVQFPLRRDLATLSWVLCFKNPK